MPYNWYRVPLLNVLYEILYDDPPTPDQLSNLMSVFALLDGLMLSLAGSTMHTFGPSDTMELHERLSEWIDAGEGSYVIKCFLPPCDNLLDDFVKLSNLGFTLLAGSTLMLVMLYLATASMNFATEDGGKDIVGITAWWYYIRWLIICVTVLTALGMTAVVVSVQEAWVLKMAVTPAKIAQLYDQCFWLDVVILAGISVLFTLAIASIGLVARENAHGRSFIIQRDMSSAGVSSSASLETNPEEETVI